MSVSPDQLIHLITYLFDISPKLQRYFKNWSRCGNLFIFLAILIILIPQGSARVSLAAMKLQKSYQIVY